MFKLNYLLFTISLILSSSTSFGKSITIGSKAFSESFILSEMLAIILEENYDIEVKRKMGLGGTMVAFDALKNGEIDVYPDYTGTGYVMILGHQNRVGPNEVLNIVKKEYKEKFKILWSKPLGFNNTYALAVRYNDKIFDNIGSLSQLKSVKKAFKYAAPHEFMERKDGHVEFAKYYQLSLPSNNVFSMEAGLMYSALKEESIDIGVVYSTDGRIKANNLKVLEDDKDFFPPYYAAFNFTEEAKSRVPELILAIEELEGNISEKEMITLNFQSDKLKIPPKVIAHNFLVKKEILQANEIKVAKNLNFFQYAYSRRSYLIKLIAEHIGISLSATLIASLFGLPLGIYLTRNKSASRFVFPIINSVQTIPSIALLGALIPLMGIGIWPALVALFLYALLPIVRNTYTGIMGVNSHLVEAAKGIGLTSYQVLKNVELPLAMPVILSGVRTALVIVIGTTTLAALIGAGGLGGPIFRGVSTVNTNLLLLGAIPSALLAIVADSLLTKVEKKIVSKGIR